MPKTEGTRPRGCACAVTWLLVISTTKDTNLRRFVGSSIPVAGAQCCDTKQNNYRICFATSLNAASTMGPILYVNPAYFRASPFSHALYSNPQLVRMCTNPLFHNLQSSPATKLACLSID